MLQNNVEDLQSEKYRSQKTAMAATAQLLTQAQVISYRAAGTPADLPLLPPDPGAALGIGRGSWLSLDLSFLSLHQKRQIFVPFLIVILSRGEATFSCSFSLECASLK